MKKRIIVILLAIAVVATLFFYSQKRLNSVTARPEPKALPEYSDASRAIETAVGEEFIISLDSNRTTGYGWQIAGALDPDMLKIVEIQHRSPVTRLVGAGGKDTWTLLALRPGSAQISFEYVRPWEKDVPPAKKSSFTVTIK